ncbi:MAG: hypothetical protein WD278_12030 [Pirellulales bacterium]
MNLCFMNLHAKFPRRLFALALAVCIVVLTASVAEACPTCKAALASHDPGRGDLVAGFFWSILFMMSMPFILLGSLATYMYLLVRRARREAAVPPSHAPAGKPAVPDRQRDLEPLGV